MVPGTSTPEQLAANIRAEVARWVPIVKAAASRRSNHCR
jgi:tripartite-type tricarboxylate transporter receptor subunit TctC